MKFTFTVVLFLCLTACKTVLSAENSSGQNVYTLYRDGVHDKKVRMLHASFATQGQPESWNKDNCNAVMEYLNETQKVHLNPAIFWCEKGPFKAK